MDAPPGEHGNTDRIDAAYRIADGEMPEVGDTCDKTKFKVFEVKSSRLLASIHSKQTRRLNLRDCDGKATVMHTSRIDPVGAWIDNPQVKTIGAGLAIHTARELNRNCYRR